MSVGATQRSSNRLAIAPIVRWRSRPIAEGGARLAAWLVPTALAALITAIGGGSPRWALAGAGLMTLAQWRMFLSVEYELNRQGITRKTRGRPRHIAWSTIARFEDAGMGAWLVLRDGLTGGCRGVMLPYGEKREAVVAALQENLSDLAGVSTEGDYDLSIRE